MTDAPAVSVVMPVYNGADVIERALATVFAQSFGDFEVIVVNDGSTDGLRQALQKFPDGRLWLMGDGQNRGASAARNMGIRAARGEYVAFLDCDDEWLPEKLARQYAALQSCAPEIAVSITGYYLRRDRLDREEPRPLRAERDWYWRLLGGCTVLAGSGLMVRKQVYDEVGYYAEDMRRFEDWDWLLRYTVTRSIAAVEEPLAIYHSGLHWPSVETVAVSCRQIWDRHGATASACSAAAARLLRSTLAYERAAALYHHQHPFRAVEAVAQSLLLYPPRGVDFYWHLLRRGKDLAAWRFG